ncbi:MAG: Cell envelope-associated transcriptional attenuator LytR-CpsA-Psr, subfamily A1 (as in PMID19099556) [uncultured Nocardioidaceae bacterium]|uniref:Cell envelope-associated transcriptional attenuator LytR-CpsA-Psr, subfamily A1 (As in PMID19099556) n=1 Tax=uncultured Nocardioidaceae bacterium TaxID=253824 RepID=A0A6J4MZX1_9ACTN|nr:MAG: Cell envelope-associated transcriptional attenuator LytR-CpsA-Psr, subfamily A1 (as in PMID19099556) [uncultured Nocardioidaceae bacterium]
MGVPGLGRHESARDPVRRAGRLVAFACLLAALALVVPDAARPPAQAALIKLEQAKGLDATDGVVWFLALGSDARPGEPVLRSRSDAIQLVGINARSGRATTIGIPRDTYVPIPGFGSDKINAAMVYGGPELTARAVTAFTGIRPDYVFTTNFGGLTRMVDGIEGVRVKVRLPANDLGQTFRRGLRTFDGVEALAFARIRYGLPRGDFDRSMNQGLLLRGALATIVDRQGRLGFVERAIGYFARYTDTNVGPAELYQLARTVLEVDPARVSVCVLEGRTGVAGGASVVLPNVAAARALARDVRRDAEVDGKAC